MKIQVLKCPVCGRRGKFRIAISGHMDVDGSFNRESMNVEPEQNADTMCLECRHMGGLDDFYFLVDDNKKQVK